ncbi:retrovirus-related pol polyprotein from transposon TNT 1-94 [Tanacetum coccineum]|uniref:Retrovirus-related pol polyprotein from transposon TNT 1-94 n=1 Tax=Tanacetum coccineum TaxID=301880 RepID=A0ABQ5JCK2_9ASTR
MGDIDLLKQTLPKQLKEKESLMQTVTLLKNDFKKEESRNIDREIALEKKIKQLDDIVYKRDQSSQTVHMLTKPQFFYDHTTKHALEKKVNTTPVDYVALNQLSQDFEKQFVLQTELSGGQAFWSQNSMNSSDPSPSCRPTKVEVPKELPKVSMVNTSLKKLKHHLAGFDVVVKERTIATAIIEGSKDKIQRTLSSTQRNKVEAYPRTDKSSLNNKKCVVKPKGTAHVQHSKLNTNSELICVKCNGFMLSNNHDLYVLNDVNARAKSKSVKKISKRKVWKPTGKVFTKTGYTWRPTGRTFTIVGNACPLTRITTTAEVPPKNPTALETETPKPVVTLVYSKKPKKSKTNDPVSKHKIIKSISAKNKEPSKSWGSTISDVPSSSLDDCRLSKLFPEGVDLLTGSQGNNLYTLSLGDMMASSPISRHGLVRGLPKLKFEKDHLCSAYAMGKSKKKPHNTNQEKLYLLHMDLCGPMRVESVNGKKYILVIVDDYSQFTWVKCLRSKDEAPDFIIKFLKMIQKVGISHETSVARSSQQNGVVKRRNRMQIEATRAMLIYAKSLLFLWAEAVATTSPDVITPIAEVVAPEPAASTGSPSSTTVDQDAPSPSNSQTLPETQSPVISNDVEEENHDLDVKHMNNYPSFGILIPENDSEASSSSIVILTVVHTAAPYSEHINK